ncbi:MAG: hypothetical protein BroJett040_21100 [Oligoflexia bacterium]|nr:MAG: hypothetical protein BroJett040_21100 [Oligoflexia bacterium]
MTPLVEAGDFSDQFWVGPFFWDTKKEVREKINNEKYLAVSVTKENNKDQTYWWMKGAGLVEAPQDFSFQIATDFSRLKKMTHAFSHVEWTPSKGILDLRVKLPMREVPIKFFIQILENENPRRIHYSVIEGSFKNSEGVILVHSAKHQLTEVNVIGRYRGELPVKPDFLIAFAVEGMMQHVATSLRSNIEAEWKSLRSAK